MSTDERNDQPIVTRGDAIEILKRLRTETVEENIAIGIAIQALDKQVPRAPVHVDKNDHFDGNWKRMCPRCSKVLVERVTTPDESYPIWYWMERYCTCGQHILWSE